MVAVYEFGNRTMEWTKCIFCIIALFLESEGDPNQCFYHKWFHFKKSFYWRWPENLQLVSTCCMLGKEVGPGNCADWAFGVSRTRYYWVNPEEWEFTVEGRLTGISTAQPRVFEKLSGKATQPGLTKTGLKFRNWKVIQDMPVGLGYLAAPSAAGICPSLLRGLTAKVIQLLLLPVFLLASFGFCSCYQLLSSLLISHLNSFSERI